MDNDRDSSDLLERAYKIAKLIAITTASVAGFVVSLVALDVTKGHWWVDVKIPLYATVFIVVFVLIVSALASIGAVLVARDARGSMSFYRNKSRTLEDKMSALRDLAYNDPITGIPNSNKLQKDIDEGSDEDRCLVLLDLENFGEINKKYNHWIGDEYLRRFAHMVSSSSRRNEFLFKSRPLNADAEPRPKDEVKAFRKGSGGDEFYILLEGTIIDALGYLNRLIKRKPEFEQMSFEVMKARHPFGFSAGVVSVGYGESFKSVNEHVSECLGHATEKGAQRKVYWFKTQMPERITESQRNVLDETDRLFRKADGVKQGVAQVTDKDGISILLSDERWRRIREEHGEVATYRFEVLDAIREPERIAMGTHGGLLAMKTQSDGRMLVAVYDVQGSGGFVVTAFLSRRTGLLKNRKQTWPLRR
jgi:GGDEF domain-containing protein